MVHLSRDDILKLARLSKLDLSEEQITRFRCELESIVEYVDQLKGVDVEGLEPTNQVSGLVNVMREDEIRKYAPPSEFLKNVPQKQGDYIKVKRVIE